MIFLYGCASPKSPTGGPKDVTPPAIVESASTPNRQKNFHQKEITIVFDEWVVLKDIYTQLVVSPLMPSNPEIKLKGKGIVIKLPDNLKENTTYTINFGNAIADLNEGNVLENYAFVFSTGDVLDSIKLSGVVTDAFTLKPADGIWVMLYPVGEDSAVYKRKPDYIAKTNKDGKWTMSNIRVDSFRVVALKDDNQNFLYDQEGEEIGWLDKTINTSQPLSVLPDLWVSSGEKKPIIREVIHYAPGWMKVIVDAPLPKPVPDFLPAIESKVIVWDKDTLQVWYKGVNNYAGYVVLNGDSTRVRTTLAPSMMAMHARLKITSGRLHPNASATFISIVPIMSVDTGKFLLHHDSLGTSPLKIVVDDSDKRKISLKASWVGPTKYNLTILPGAITDFWGRMNDTIKQPILVGTPDQYGDLTMNIEGLDSSKQYVLLIKQAEQIIDTFVLQHQHGGQLKKGGLLPGKYTLELIEDLNHNGLWDTGNYGLKRQPERKMIYNPDNLRAGWELEAKVVWSM